MEPRTEEYALKGLEDLGKLAYVCMVGGVADRFFEGKGGPCLHAMGKIPFLHRTLLDWILDSIESETSLYRKCFNKEPPIRPVFCMCSKEGWEHWLRHVQEDRRQLKGKGKMEIIPLIQGQAPLLDRRGKWQVQGKALLTKPGGHGMVWRVLFQLQDTFQRTQEVLKRCSHLVMRQVNNPLCGLGGNALSVFGAIRSHPFGKRQEVDLAFSTVPVQAGMHEGRLGCDERGRVRHMEYSDFHHEMEDEGDANCNLFAISIQAASEATLLNPFPGPLFNDKGKGVSRVELCMQNISDECRRIAVLSFPRERTCSTIKFAHGQQETHLSCIKQWMRVHKTFLEEECNASCSDSFLWTYHPSLGPLFSVIKSKVRGGHYSGYWECTISEVDVAQLDLEGSLIIRAENDRAREQGRCELRNVKVRNRGLRSTVEECAKGVFEHQESMTISFQGMGSFIAHEVTFSGPFSLHVKDGECVHAIQEGGRVVLKSHPSPSPPWHWEYRWEHKHMEEEAQKRSHPSLTLHKVKSERNEYFCPDEDDRDSEAAT